MTENAPQFEDPPVATLDGPNGKAEIYEVWSAGQLKGYEVYFGGQVESFPNLGEAYITAGEKAGVKT